MSMINPVGMVRFHAGEVHETETTGSGADQVQAPPAQDDAEQAPAVEQAKDGTKSDVKAGGAVDAANGVGELMKSLVPILEQLIKVLQALVEALMSSVTGGGDVGGKSGGKDVGQDPSQNPKQEDPTQVGGKKGGEDPKQEETPKQKETPKQEETPKQTETPKQDDDTDVDGKNGGKDDCEDPVQHGKGKGKGKETEPTPPPVDQTGVDGESGDEEEDVEQDPTQCVVQQSPIKDES